MPNTYIKPEARVNLALALLHKLSRFNGLVTPFDGRNFVGARGDTLFYETKGITKARDYEWRTRSNPIEFDEIYKTRLSITINQHMTQGVKFTDEEATLDLASYQREILTPQMEAVAERWDSKILAKLTGYSDFKTNAMTAIDLTADTTGAQALKVGLKIKQQADKDGVPTNGRILVAGADLYAYLVTSGLVPQYDSAQAGTAFREGVFGKIAGMELFDGTGIIDDGAFTVVHPSWMILANAAPVIPDGVSWGARAVHEGVSLRIIKDYDANYLQDRSILNTFYGFSPIEDEYKRHTSGSAASAADGSEAGDIIIDGDGEPEFTGKNVRGLRGTVTGFSL